MLKGVGIDRVASIQTYDIIKSAHVDLGDLKKFVLLNIRAKCNIFHREKFKFSYRN